MKRTSAADVARVAVVAVFAVVTARLLVRSLGWPLVHDAPVMHYIAWRIGEGAVPYRDLFDMNFPGTYLVHLAVLRVLGTGDAGWRVFDLAWLAAAAALLAVFARPWGALPAIGAALCFAAYHLAGGSWNAGQRDFLLCPFLIAGAVGVALWAERPRATHDADQRSLQLAGLAVGAGMTIKPHVAGFALGLAVVVVVTAVRSGGGVATSLASFLVPIAVAPVAVIVWIASVGGLRAWRDVVVEYLVPLYSRLGRAEPWTVDRWHLWVPLGGAVAISVVSAVSQRRFTVRHAVAALGVGYGGFHFLVQGKHWEYHLYPLAAFAALLAFAELDALARGDVSARPRRAPAIALGLVLTALALALSVKGVDASEAPWARDKVRRAEAVVRDLEPLLGPGDTVQVLDTTDGGLHTLLRLHVREPTRFLYDFHFFHDTASPVVRALRGELMRDLRAHPPRAIVVFERGWPRGGYERLDGFPELASFVREAYRPVAGGDGYMVHAQRHRP
ncbi:MAG TPA: hypothetical protein VGL09_18015 [Methylomirabilota bacterium]